MVSDVTGCGTDTGQSMINDATVAGFYSTLAGVLAGFAFAALMLIITLSLENRRARPDGRPDSRPSATATAVSAHTIAMLFAAFISLAISSLTYAVVAGTDDYDAASIGNGSAAPTLCVSAFLLVMAVHLLIVDAQMGEAANVASMRAAGLTLFIGAAYLGVGILESSYQLDSHSLRDWATGWLGSAAGIALVATIIPRRDITRSRRIDPLLDWMRQASSVCISALEGWRIGQKYPGGWIMDRARQHSALTWFAQLSVGVVVAFSIIVSVVVGTLDVWPAKVSIVAMAGYTIVGVTIVRSDLLAAR